MSAYASAESQPGSGARTMSYNQDEIYQIRKDVEKALLYNPCDIRNASRSIKHMLSIECPLNVKYHNLSLAKIIGDNCKEIGCLMKLENCLGKIADKYGRPLLMPSDRRPSDWRIIRFKNEKFEHDIDFIIGSRDILHMLGYTMVTQIGLVYPQNVEPVRERVATLLAEIIMVQHELLGYSLKTHPHPRIIEDILPWYVRRNPVPPRMGEPTFDPPLRVFSPPSSISRQLTNGNPVYYSSLVSPPMSYNPSSSGVSPPMSYNPSSSGVNHNSSVGNRQPNANYCPPGDSPYNRPALMPNIPTALMPINRPELVPDSRKALRPNIQSASMHNSQPMDGRFSHPTGSKLSPDQCTFGQRMYTGPPDRNTSYTQAKDSFSHPKETAPSNISHKVPFSGPLLPTVLDTAITMDPEDLDEVRENIKQGHEQHVAAGIPLLPIFLDDELASVVEPPTSSDPPETDDFKQNALAQKCIAFQQQLEDIDYQQREIIRIDSSFFINRNYKVLRQKQRETERLLSNAQNELDKLSEPEGDIDMLEKDLDISKPPAVYVPIKYPKDIQPQHPSDESYIDVLPSGPRECPRCLKLLKPGSTRCYVCENGFSVNESQNNSKNNNEKRERSIETSSYKSQIEARVSESWRCQYCTFMNDASKRICDVCAKTRSDLTEEVAVSLPVNSETFESVLSPSGKKSIAVRLMEEEEDIIKEKRKAKEEFLRNDNRNSTNSDQHQSPTSKAESPPKSPPKRSVSAIHPSHDRPRCPSDVEQFQSLPEDYTLRGMELKANRERLEQQGRVLVAALKAAEERGFTPREFDLAYQKCEEAGGGPTQVLSWLITTWKPLVSQLQARVAQVGPLHITEEEAKQALLDCNADTSKATQHVIHYKLEKIHEVMRHGPFQADQVQEELAQTEGDVLETVRRLNKKMLEDFSRRIADSTDGAVHPLLDTSFYNDVINPEIDVERRLRMLLAEGKLQSWGRAELVAKIVKHTREESLDEEDWSNVTLEDIVDVVRGQSDYRMALSHLQQECEVCYIRISKNKLRKLVCCECNVCTDCLRQHFEIRVRERHVREWVCPVCSEPDFEDEERRDQHFQFMDLLLKNVVKQEVFDLFEQKLRDWTLMNDPDFRWCSHCDFGQFHDNDATLKMTCCKCQKHTCFECRRPWEEQHEGINCEQFREWKEANNPELQQQGLAKVLAENGIDCPACKFRYSLAKGGCMHFRCTQCRHEFCSGCLRPFKRGKNCIRYDSCNRAGLHCHHPRDCLFYLRDYGVDNLQKLLKDHKVEYNTTGPDEEAADGAGARSGGLIGACPVIEQKELQDGFKDEACGLAVVDNYAGLCVVHYKEYLVSLINKNKIDPVEIMEEKQLVGLLEKHNVPPRQRKKGEAPELYKKHLIEFIHERIPLPVTEGRPLPAATGGKDNEIKGKNVRANPPKGIRRVPVENAEEAVQWI